MAKYRKKGRRSHKMTLPVSVVAPMALAAYNIADKVMKKDTAGAMQLATGFGTDGKFYSQYFLQTYGPIVGGAIIHKAAGYLGVNRMIANAKIPLIRV